MGCLFTRSIFFSESETKIQPLTSNLIFLAKTYVKRSSKYSKAKHLHKSGYHKFELFCFFF